MPYPISDHYDGAHFFNPEPTIRNTGGKRISIFTFFRMRRDPAIWSRWPKHVENIAYPPPGPPPSITFIGHSTFLIRLPGLTLLTDPVFSARCSPTQLAGPKRVRAPGIALENLPPIDLILLSHNHYDHMDLISLRALRRRNPQVVIVTTLGNASYLAKKGLPSALELDWWQSARIDQEVATVMPPNIVRVPNKIVEETVITATPARHFAARWLNDRNETLWSGFLLEHAGKKIYFAGDTGYTKYFSEIHARLGAPDLALLPIGAYEPRSFMGPVHMNPEDAIKAFHDLHATRAIGMHFGTFQLTAEPINAPLHDLETAKTKNENFTTLDIGESSAF